MRMNRHLRPLVDELYSRTRVGGGGGVVPGFGPPLTTSGTAIALHINATTGVDSSSADGSAAKPFKTAIYAYDRLLYLYGDTPFGPNLTTPTTPNGQPQPFLSTATPFLEVQCDTNLLANDALGLLGTVMGPAGTQVNIRGAAATVLASGTFTAIAQTFNRTVTPAHLWRLTDAAQAWAPFAAAQDMIHDTTANTITFAEADQGGGTVQTGQWFTPLDPTLVTPLTAPTITAPGTNPYQVLSLGTAPLGVGEIRATQRGAIAGAVNPFAVNFYRIRTTDVAAAGCRGKTDGQAVINMIECSIGSFFEPAQSCNILNSVCGPISCFDNDHRALGGLVNGSTLHDDETSNMIFDGDLLMVATGFVQASVGGANLGLVGTTSGGSPQFAVGSSGNVQVANAFYGASLVYSTTAAVIPIECFGNGCFFVQTSFAANINLPGTLGFVDTVAGSGQYVRATVTASGADTIHDQQTGSIVGSSQPTQVFPQQVLVGGGAFQAGLPGVYQGAAAPTLTAPQGSLYLRTGGGVGTTLYVTQGGGVWNPVAGV